MTTPAASMNKTAANMQGTYESAKKTEASYEGQFKAENAAYVAQVVAVFNKAMAESKAEYTKEIGELKSKITVLEAKGASLQEECASLKDYVQKLDTDYCNHGHWHGNTPGVCRLPEGGHNTGGYRTSVLLPQPPRGGKRPGCSQS